MEPDCNWAELIGATEYEMKAYCALLRTHPSTAYRIGKESGVPLSRIYEVVQQMLKLGLCRAVGQDPVLYSPVPPGQVLARSRARLERGLDSLQAELTQIYAGEDTASARVLHGDALVQRCRDILHETPGALFAAGPGAAATLKRTPNSTSDATEHDTNAFILCVPSALAVVGSLTGRGAAVETGLPEAVAIILTALAHDVSASIGTTARLPQLSAAPPVRAWIDWEVEKQRRLLAARPEAAEPMH